MNVAAVGSSAMGSPMKAQPLSDSRRVETNAWPLPAIEFAFDQRIRR